MRETSLESQYGWTRSVDKRASRGRAARMISDGKLASRRLGNTRMEPERSHCLDSQNLTNPDGILLLQQIKEGNKGAFYRMPK